MDIFALVMVTCSWLYTDITLGSPTENSKQLEIGAGSPKPPEDIKTLLETFPVYRTIGEKFSKTNYEEIGPTGLLYVHQRELAAAHPSDDNVQIIGSDDATTCIVAILRHSESGAAAVGHFDGVGGEGGARAMVDKVKKLTTKWAFGRLELSLVGGVIEPKGNVADEVFSDLINGFHKQEVKIVITLAFIGELNTQRIKLTNSHRPLFTGAGISLKSGQIFPATFSFKGPDAELRLTRCIAGVPEMVDVYDNQMGMMKIGPFSYKVLRKRINKFLMMSDDELLHAVSTTPAMEPPNFVKQMREAFMFQTKNPKPLKTVFKHNEPHYFQRNSYGLWDKHENKSEHRNCSDLIRALLSFIFPSLCN